MVMEYVNSNPGVKQMATLPKVSDILTDPCASYWLKDALKTAMRRDCVDAYYDAKLLSDMLKAYMDTCLGRR